MLLIIEILFLVAGLWSIVLGKMPGALDGRLLVGHLSVYSLTGHYRNRIVWRLQALQALECVSIRRMSPDPKSFREATINVKHTHSITA